LQAVGPFRHRGAGYHPCLRNSTVGILSRRCAPPITPTSWRISNRSYRSAPATRCRTASPPMGCAPRHRDCAMSFWVGWTPRPSLAAGKWV